MNDFQTMKQDIIAGNDTELKNAMIMADSAMETLHSMREIEELYGTHIDGAKQALEDDDTVIRKVRRTMNNMLEAGQDEQFQTFFTAATGNDYPAPIGSLRNFADEAKRSETVKKYFKENVKPANDKHPNFELLNDKNVRPDVLQAIALHYLAAEYEENEKMAQVEVIVPISHKVPDMRPVSTGYINSFKEKANTILNNAAEIFSDKGHKKLAQLCKDSVDLTDTSSSKLTIEKFAQEAMSNHRSITLGINAILDPIGTREPPYTSNNEEWLAKISRCASLADGSGSESSKKPELAL